ncbi:glycosyltransferase family 4 protein [Aquella oligotrophica]|uniref:Glycosyltransferase n=1 Tax=Aquella oligotrophica TaxID=2067065 RepID=A0A2I7N571_9NEIS|nr:glycosyltransferase family 4 protein [Aquella oligotrophica]AUR51598.1 hypothetical protein CUN60_04600 [Aquella oligotrophica]
MSKRLLVVCPFACYPSTHGGKLDIYNSLIQLASVELNICVDLLYCDYEKQSSAADSHLKKYAGINEIHFLQIKKNKFLSLLYLFYYKPNYSMLYRCLADFKPEQQYDYILIHGFHADSILENVNLTSARFFYRMHNYEYAYSMQKIPLEKNLLMKLLRLYDNLKIKFREKWLIAKTEKVLCISSEEYKFFSASYGKKIYFLPTYLDTSKFVSFKNSNKPHPIVLFVGNLFTLYNKEALIWYLENIHGRIKSSISDYKFIIAGSTAGSDTKWLQDIIQKDKHINVYFNVEDMAAIYQMAKVFVNPMQNGAGVKLKTLDGIINGIPVVSTTVGASGTGLSHRAHCLIADSINEFCNAVILLLQDASLARSLVDNGQQYLKEKFCSLAILDTIYD